MKSQNTLRATPQLGISQLHIEYAHRWHQRLLGLMFRQSLPEGRALLLSPCSSVHTAFMRFAIDVVFLDAGYRVLVIRANLPPWWGAWGPRGTRHTLELSAGSVDRLGWQTGQSLDAFFITHP
jgi:uncharacterized membrane protein (UPF0127 family)